jgi:hydrogenase maturation protease
MNQAVVDRIVNAVLYEGYILYPYRPSIKNRQRWTFGGLFPRSWATAHNSGDSWFMRTECLLRGHESSVLDVHVRFLHLIARQVGELDAALDDLAEGDEPAFRTVEKMTVGDRLLQSWQEAMERVVTLSGLKVDRLIAPVQQPFTFPARRAIEAVRGPTGQIEAILLRRQDSVSGLVEVSAAQVGEGLFKIMVQVENATQNDSPIEISRDVCVLNSLASTHTILGVRNGAFLSLIDPPDQFRVLASLCRNEGTWPVLVGNPGETDAILSSPITLYDYPQIAAESPGDFYDSTEIDEMLVLRILTLSDEEKQAAAAVDEHARNLLTRTCALGEEQLMELHGKMRGMSLVPAENQGE